ncbi:MAG: hypothetical protein FJX80_05995 [Bacteroidetes bacterium]|nr:hypothetical protein [Bacteroidota bacterium]
MTIEEIKNIIEPYIDEPTIHFNIEKQIFSEDSGREIFNEKIRQNVEKRFGVYIWLDTATNEIVYIGMAGKVKTDGTLGDHSIQNRLLASRGKDKSTKKDILTNDYVSAYMIDNDVEKLDFYVMYSKTGEPPAYIEALLLYKYYKKNNRLPKLNNSF